MLEEKINELKKRLIDYTTLVMSMVEKSVNGLVDRKEDLLVSVVEKDEPRANNFEIELDEVSTTLIVQL